MSSPFYDPFPKYLQIRDIIVRRLRLLNPGDRLPTEMELAAEFQVSRVTIRQVLHTLSKQGTIARRPRIGTYLVTVPNLPADNRLTGPIEEFTALGITTETQVAGQGPLTAPADVAAALKLTPPGRGYEIRRVRILDGMPLLLLEAYFPVDVGRRVARRNLRGGLIVPALREMLDPEIREEYQQIDALSATAELARQLKIEKGDPILCVKRLFVDGNGRPVVFFKTNFRADRYYYTVKLPQPVERSSARGAKNPSRTKAAVRTRRTPATSDA
jgi:GntR family transcriptional regulator